MTDHFAVLGLARAPWVDAEALKERFHRLGAKNHPDAADGSSPAFAEINAAWQTLRDPAKCLRHYLEMEHPASLAGVDGTPPDIADLFMDIAAFLPDAQHFAARNAAGSPLSRALLEPERIALRNRLDSLAASVAARMEAITARLREETLTSGELATLLASLVFLGKWSPQLAEARLSL